MYEFGVSVDPRCRFKWFATNLAQVRSCILTVFPMHLTLMSLQISYRRKPAISYIKHEFMSSFIVYDFCKELTSVYTDHME